MKEQSKNIALCIWLSLAATVVTLVVTIVLYDYKEIADKAVPIIYIALQTIISIVMTIKSKKTMLCPLTQLIFSGAFGIFAPIVIVCLGSFASRFDIRFLKDLFAMFFGPAIFSGFYMIYYILRYAWLTTFSFVVSLITALITGGVIKIKEKISEKETLQ